MLYGRDAERAEIGRLLKAARNSTSGALVIYGEPGIGKTALLEDARDRAGDMHVLTARGIASEAELPFAALDQLVRPALGYLDRLPGPQAAALGGALGLKEGAGEERFLVYAACLSLLSELADRRPVLCLVDDAHWLDRVSADALLFVARRLGAEGIVMLFAAREGEVRGFDAEDLPSLLVERLDPEASATLLGRVAGSVAPSVRERLIEQTQGNALALVELPLALSDGQLAGEEPLPEALPLTTHLESIFLERVRRLPSEAQRVLLIASADDLEDGRLVARAAEVLGADSRALDLAEQAGLVSVHRNRLEFRHPLVRSAVYEAATANERRAAHRALAEALAGADEHADRRAWHLAASVLEPDEDVVRALEEAGARAEERAGYAAAARAFARAAELSSDEHDRGRRLARATRAASTAGADEYAVELAAEADPLVGDTLLRAELELAVGVAELRCGHPLDGFSKLTDAAREVAEHDAAKAVELLIWANAAASISGDPSARAEVSGLAADVASAGGDDELMSVARALAAFARVRGGDTSSDGAQLEEAFAQASTSDDAQHVYAVSVAALFVGDNQRFATLINRATSLARARGQLGILAEALSMSAAQHYLAQRFEEAALVAREALQFARQLGAVNSAATPLGLLAFAAAIRGDDEEARRRSGEMLELAAAHGLTARATYAMYVLAMLELGHGRWNEALEHFRVVSDPRPDVGDAFLAKGATPDAIEAAVRAGHMEEARDALSEFEEWAPDSGYPWVQPRLSACRALLSDGEQATAHFEEAVRLGAGGGPFDCARIQLLYGEHLRRERRRVDARVQLRASLDAFERFRAEPWAERARVELRASGETARKRDPSTADQLTPQELQIARLVAEGLSNKEVAAQLFLSPRTIEHHLRHVFAKLGIKSRTQLARLPLGPGLVVAIGHLSVMASA
ncbi:MAG TPA: AAA family ATPase [Gaiellaceae bacterium]|nr:AAA family ATPase [Gaiellaceae bacterium]